jgi:uncharacterized protein (UPF0297 family)
MNDPIKEFQKLSKLAEAQQSKRDKISGAMDQIAKTLKAKGFKSLNEAIKFVVDKTKERAQKEKILESKVKKFSEKYNDYLN